MLTRIFLTAWLAAGRFSPDFHAGRGQRTLVDTLPIGAGQAGLVAPDSAALCRFDGLFARFHALKNCRKPCRARLSGDGLRPSLFFRFAPKKRRAAQLRRSSSKSLDFDPASSSWTDDCAGLVELASLVRFCFAGTLSRGRRSAVALDGHATARPAAKAHRQTFFGIALGGIKTNAARAVRLLELRLNYGCCRREKRLSLKASRPATSTQKH